jgi:transposase
MPKQYPIELRQRAVRLVAEQRDQYQSEYEAIRSIATKLGISTAETLRKWVRRAEIDGGQRAGTTSQESVELRKLRAEVDRAAPGQRFLVSVYKELSRPPDRTSS